jgi:hypothetical protein
MNAIARIFAPREFPGENVLVEASLARAAEEILTVEFPPLSPLDRERQDIASKRQIIATRIEDCDCAIAHHEYELSKYQSDRGEYVRILAGLDKHEAELSDPPISPKPRAKGRG